MVETALVLPVLLAMSLGVLQLALYAHAYNVLVTATQEGARLAGEDGRTLHEGWDRARELVTVGLRDAVEPIVLGGRQTDDLVELTATTRLRPILPLPPGVRLSVEAHALVTRERFRPGGGRP
jgi:Flp pilus assembly protein TadG